MRRNPPSYEEATKSSNFSYPVHCFFAHPDWKEFPPEMPAELKKQDEEQKKQDAILNEQIVRDFPEGFGL